MTDMTKGEWGPATITAHFEKPPDEKPIRQTGITEIEMGFRCHL
jgi:hypothetical protein